MSRNTRMECIGKQLPILTGLENNAKPKQNLHSFKLQCIGADSPVIMIIAVPGSDNKSIAKKIIRPYT